MPCFIHFRSFIGLVHSWLVLSRSSRYSGRPDSIIWLFTARVKQNKEIEKARAGKPVKLWALSVHGKSKANNFPLAALNQSLTRRGNA